jgi:hypothetical protein
MTLGSTETRIDMGQTPVRAREGGHTWGAKQHNDFSLFLPLFLLCLSGCGGIVESHVRAEGHPRACQGGEAGFRVRVLVSDLRFGFKISCLGFKVSVLGFRV